MKIGSAVTPVEGKVYANFGFLVFFPVLELGPRTGQTDRQTDGQERTCGLLGRQHNNKFSSVPFSLFDPIQTVA